MSEGSFERYARYYDLLNGDKDYDREAEYVALTLTAASPHIRSLLEFGSGTGRHGHHLAARGFDVVGIDRSSAMVAQARFLAGSAGPPTRGSFTCEQGDIRSFRAGRAFDAVVSLFHVVSYQTTNADALATFANAARHLRPDGLFFFDVWHGPAVLSERPTVRIKRVGDESIRVIRIAEPELDTSASVVTVRYSFVAQPANGGECVAFQEEHRMRYFFPTEIGLLAERTGFNVVTHEEFLTTRPASDNRTWGRAYLLRRTSQAST